MALSTPEQAVYDLGDGWYASPAGNGQARKEVYGDIGGNPTVDVIYRPVSTAESKMMWDSWNSQAPGRAKAEDQAAADHDFDFGNLILPALLAMSGAGVAGAFGGGLSGAAGAGALGDVWGAEGLGGAFGGAGSGTALTGSSLGLTGAGLTGAGAGATGAANMGDWWTDLGLTAQDVGMDAGAWSTNPSMADLTGGVLTDAGSAAEWTQALGQLPSGTQQVAKTLLQKLMGGDMSAISDLTKLGLPAALVAGLFEKNNNPLTGNVTTAANNALSSAGAFGAMPSVGMQPSWQKAIDTANTNTGAWQPYVDKASTYTNEAAAGIPSVDLSQYMNPYIANTLDPTIRAINLSADQQRQRLAHLARVSGNDTYSTPGSDSSTRYGVEEGTLNDNRFKQIGDATANAYKGAFDSALTTAGADLNRKGSAGGAFNTLANTVGTQGRGDVTTLAGAGDLEAKPKENALTHAADTSKLYASVIPGTTSAITATNQPSILGQAVGAFGAYNAATKPGGMLA